MTKREQTVDAVWRAIDPSSTGYFREAAEIARDAIRALPHGTFADEVALAATERKP